VTPELKLWLKRLLIGISAFAVCGYLAIVATLYVLQRPMLYNPGKDYQNSKTLALVDAQEISIETPDGEQLVGWYRPADVGKPMVLFFHGKGGTMSNRKSRWKTYVELGYGILFFDYRGFGDSSGKPTEIGLKTDALSAFDWLSVRNKTGKDIVLTAESMGTGLAVYVAAQRPISGVSLMSGYSSIADVAAARYWWAPVNLLLVDRFDTLPFAERIAAPLLLQHGEVDRTIPIAFSQLLFEHVAATKKFIVRKNLGHNDFGPDEMAIEQQFIESL
jgi:uncharacterized protein